MMPSYRTRECGAGLASLRDEHLGILARIRHQEQETPPEAADPVLEDRIAAVTEREADREVTSDKLSNELFYACLKIKKKYYKSVKELVLQDFPQKYTFSS